MKATLTTTLETLYEYLDGLTGRPALPELAAKVARLPITCEDMAEFIRFSDQGYARNLVRAGPW
jgi:hypothetical protein